MGNKREQKISDQASAQATADRAQVGLLQQNQSNLAGSILPKYQSMYANPMSAEEKGARWASAAGPMDAGRGSAEMRVARSRNPAGLNEMEGKLALDKSASLGKTAADIGDTETSRKFEAVKGLAAMYGIDASVLAKAMGLPAEDLGVAEKAAASSSGQGLLGQGIGSGGMIGGALIM